ncbi:D-Ala-D-Ala carboxypeptidase family metallohydrolase [Arthrobacter sp. MW3 TE3886]|uniref:D-Ala-D-Ala carboxypeptidase family metallohydrolase n=1 Tax=Arthrobacter sp. MW3 TE3886 TaxID=3156254 RepID=UPI003512CE65
MLQISGFESPFAEGEPTMGSEGTSSESISTEQVFDESFQDELLRYGEIAPQTEDETFQSGLELRPATGATGPGEEHWDPTGANLPLLDTGPSVRAKKISDNFTVGELVTSGGKPADIARISPVLVQLLQAIRVRVGKPVKVTSGYRSWKRNGVVYKGYGKPPTLSQHCAGKAADIKIAGMTGMDIAKVAIDVWGPKVALGVGPDYAHVDVRGRGDSWTYFGKGTLKNSAALTELARYRKQHKGGAAPFTPPRPSPAPPDPLPIVPGATTGGGLIVRSVPLLAKHRGTPPDLVLGWNTMANPTAIDVVVHLHGFSANASRMRIDTEMRRISGLDLGSRTRPTLTVLPRGDFYGGSSGRGYDFPALTAAGALDRLVDDAVARFTRATGVSAPRGRLVLTAHSGGGKAMLAIVAQSDPDEVYVFDALYQPATALAQWAARRIPAGTGAAMRVFYRAGTAKHPGTQPASETLGKTLCTLLAAAPPAVRARFRVERTTVGHGEIPGQYGGTLLADAGSDVPDARRFACLPSAGKQAQEDRWSEMAAPDWEEWAESPVAEAWEGSGSQEQPEFWDQLTAEDEDGDFDAAEVASGEAHEAVEAGEDEASWREHTEASGSWNDSIEFHPAPRDSQYFGSEPEDRSSEKPGLESFKPEAIGAETFEPEAFDSEAFAWEALEPPQPENLHREAVFSEAFEPEELDAEYLVPAGDQSEAPAEGTWTEDRAESVARESESAAESAAGTGFEDFGVAASSAETPGASVVFPSGYSLPYAAPTAASDPAHADPHATGLPLLAIAPESLGRALSKNFTVKELASAEGTPSPIARISPELVRVLQAIRDKAGRPVLVDAGYRPSGFASAGADTESRHTSGQAADIRVSGMPGEQLAQLAIDAAGPELAIGVASDGIHVDVRGSWKLWTIIPGQAGAETMNRIALHRTKFAPLSPKPSAPDTRFSVVKRSVLATSDQAERVRLLEAGITFARGRAAAERANAGKATSVTARTRATMMAETGIGTPASPHPTLDDNVLFGRVRDDRVEDAYRAWFENPSQSAPPWILLGVWAKEGLTTPPVGPRVRGNNAADARSLWRSAFFFVNMGTDHFVKTIAVPGKDNDIARGPGSGAQHDTVFRAAVAAQVTAGRLPRNIAAEIDGELTVTAVPGAPGEFTVIASRRFAVLSLMLVDAFWRETQEAATAEVKPRPRPLDLLGMTYMRWNMRTSSWRELLRRDMTKNRDPDGTVPTLAMWAFHRRLIAGQFTVPRANALRARLNFVVFRSVYEGD